MQNRFRMMFFRYHNLGSESRVLHSGGALGPPSFLLFSSIHYQTEFRNALCQEISCRERDPTTYIHDVISQVCSWE